jgi:hypothetical protein
MATTVRSSRFTSTPRPVSMREPRLHPAVWLRMLRRIRRDIVTEAARHNVNLIMTGVFNGTAENTQAWRTTGGGHHPATGGAAPIQPPVRYIFGSRTPYRADLRDAAQHEYAALRHAASLRVSPQPVFFNPSVGPANRPPTRMGKRPGWCFTCATARESRRTSARLRY